MSAEEQNTEDMAVGEHTIASSIQFPPIPDQLRTFLVNIVRKHDVLKIMHRTLSTDSPVSETHHTEG